MSVLEKIIAASRARAPHIVLSEGEDPRVVEAAARAVTSGLARISVVADPQVFAAQAKGLKGADRIGIQHPPSSPLVDAYTCAYHDLRRHKGVDAEAARRAMHANLGFAAMMVRQGDADATIGGALATTADTVRAGLQIIGKAPGCDVVSSFFLMLLPAPFSRPVIFADCALNIEPDARALADIATASASSYRALTGEPARVAMLSFSTHASVPAQAHPSLARIKEAVDRVRIQVPDLIIDGEIQFDAAIMADIAHNKAPGSALDGEANVFVFPDLNAGNIGYKIAQRIGGAKAIGPVLQGLARPANDLSRGCSVEDIYLTIAITGAQVAAQPQSQTISDPAHRA